MAIKGFLLASILISCLVATCYGGILLSSLPKSFVVTASPTAGQVLKAGEDTITVTWALNTTLATGTDSTFKTVKVELCYAPISQKDRGWRKTVDDLHKDKTCQHTVVDRPYTPSTNNFTYTVQKDVPSATYFIRVFAFNAAGHEVGYGETTDSTKTTNLFVVEGISGRHLSLDIASVCFSAFSVVSLFGFFYMEKRKSKAAK